MKILKKWEKSLQRASVHQKDRCKDQTLVSELGFYCFNKVHDQNQLESERLFLAYRS